jgi:transcription-repair coupling factor (superfamily II helicase)
MLVNRADAFGLAQLYQLRGRVGRSTQKAYCAFLVPRNAVLTETAMKRLRAIAEFDELGSGFALAMRDLEIRGAGNLLGREQSGFLVSVGFEMYCRLLEEAVRELKGLPAEERPEPRVSTDVDAFLPDDYVEEPEEKIGFYKRLADAREPDDVDVLEEELSDRFGRLFREAEALFDLRRVRVLGSILGMNAVTVRGGRIELELAAPPSPGTLKDWMQRIRHPVEFSAAGRFVLKAKGGLSEALTLVADMAGRELARDPRASG